MKINWQIFTWLETKENNENKAKAFNLSGLCQKSLFGYKVSFSVANQDNAVYLDNELKYLFHSESDLLKFCFKEWAIKAQEHGETMTSLGLFTYESIKMIATCYGIDINELINGKG